MSHVWNIWNEWILALQALAAMGAAHAWVFWVSLVIFSAVAMIYSINAICDLEDASNEAAMGYLLVEWFMVTLTIVGTIVSFKSILVALPVGLLAYGCKTLLRALILKFEK